MMTTAGSSVLLLPAAELLPASDGKGAWAVTMRRCAGTETEEDMRVIGEGARTIGEVERAVGCFGQLGATVGPNGSAVADVEQLVKLLLLLLLPTAKLTTPSCAADSPTGFRTAVFAYN